MKKLNIGLIGNPNTGKSTLFNQLTGARQRVGNWAGVTVERKEGQFFTAKSDVRLVDLPGTRSLTTISMDTSIDERIACQYLFNDNADLIINVVDASSLESNLFLTFQLLELGLPCIIALNMHDIAQNQRIEINAAALSDRLGCPVVLMTLTRGEGIASLKEIIDIHERNLSRKLVSYPAVINEAVTKLSKPMPPEWPLQKKHWLALQMLEGDIYSKELCPVVSSLLPDIVENSDGDPGIIIADHRYQEITALCYAVSNIQKSRPNKLTENLDKVLINRWLGIPIFLAVMYMMFFLSITIGSALQPVFDGGSVALFINGTQWLGYTLHFPDWLTVFLARGIGAGINTVLPIIPQISLMYLFLSFLEDSGYMARAAFVIDRLMQSLGLPGKSFVPLIVGFGCNVPSVLGARIIDTPRERLTTILISPFMSCGARLAIFAVFAAAFFGAHGASLVFSLYLLGIVVAMITGLMLKNTLLTGEASPFVMEMPVYHKPNLKNLLIHTTLRLKMFVVRAGKVIILASMIIGVLTSFSFSGRPVDSINDSALATTSKIITPVLSPIGITSDNWQATVGLVAGIIAKEVVIGALNSLYTSENIQEKEFNPKEFSLSGELASSLTDTWEGLKNAFSLSVLSNPIKASQGDGEMSGKEMGVMSKKFGSGFAAYSYLIFVLLYIPCVSVMGAISRESGRNWMIFSFLWGLNIAYSISTLFYQTVTFKAHPGFSTLCISVVVALNAIIIMMLRYFGKRLKENMASALRA